MPAPGQIARAVVEGSGRSHETVELPGPMPSDTEIRNWRLAYLARTVALSGIALALATLLPAACVGPTPPPPPANPFVGA